jgi:hypothetical protein
MRLSYHGGGCCGVRHLHDLNGRISSLVPTENLVRRSRLSTLFKKKVKEAGRDNPYGPTRGRLVEVILADRQITAEPGWPAFLKEQGFRLVSRFNNCGGGWCNVFHHTTGTCGDETIPAWWTAAQGEQT